MSVNYVRLDLHLAPLLGAPPVFTDTAPAAKRGASLRFSNSDKANNKRKIVGRSYEEDDTTNGDSESFNDLVKRAKVDATNATTTKELPTSSVNKPTKKESNEEPKSTTATGEKKTLSKEEKSAMKAKRKAAKKLLSFED